MYEIILETSEMTIVKIQDRFEAWINGGKPEVEFLSEEAAILFAWNY